LKVEFRNSFVKDLKRLEHTPVKQQVRSVIELAEQATSLRELANIKKLRSGESYYRIRVRNYRLGLILEEDTLVFVRFLHRKDLYRYFP
jgi:addiction module RelE/StbE family toxin